MEEEKTISEILDIDKRAEEQITAIAREILEKNDTNTGVIDSVLKEAYSLGLSLSEAICLTYIVTSYMEHCSERALSRMALEKLAGSLAMMAGSEEVIPAEKPEKDAQQEIRFSSKLNLSEEKEQALAEILKSGFRKLRQKENAIGIAWQINECLEKCSTTNDRLFILGGWVNYIAQTLDRGAP